MLFRISTRVTLTSKALLSCLLFSAFSLAHSAPDLQLLLFEASPLADEQNVPAPAPLLLTTVSTLSKPFIQNLEHPYLPNDLGAPEKAITLEEFFSTNARTSIEPPNAVDADIARYKALIQELELKGGAYEERLSEELLALASLYQKTGDYAEAQTIFNRAAHVARVHNGLFDASQIPLLKKVIENYVELGDLQAADQQQKALFYMQQKLYTDTELLPGLRYFAQWNLFAATTDISPSALVDTSASREKPISDRISFQFEHLLTAQYLYDRIQQMLLRNPDLQEGWLAEAERQSLVISHLLATRYTPYTGSFAFSGFSDTDSLTSIGDMAFRRQDLSYRSGIDILERRIQRLQQQPFPDMQAIAEAKITLADWLLLFDRRMTSLKLLEETYQDLVASNASEVARNRLLHPPVPQEIPVFLTSRYSRADLGIPESVKLAYKGFIDVEFRLNRFGSPSGLKVLGASPDTDEQITARLLSHIRYARFRPRVHDGLVKDADLLQLRYHYTY